MNEWWTLAEVLRWYRTRSREAVAMVVDDHQYAPDMAPGMEAAALAEHLGEGPDDPEDGELRNESPRALIQEYWDPTSRQHPILRTLTTAAAEGRVEVLGRREGEGRPEPIPDYEWTALALDVIEGVAWTTADNLNEGVQPRVAWRDTRWQVDKIKELWPPEQEPDEQKADEFRSHSRPGRQRGPYYTLLCQLIAIPQVSDGLRGHSQRDQAAMIRTQWTKREYREDLPGDSTLREAIQDALALAERDAET